MICLLVELSGYRQLLRLQPELVRGVSGDVKHLLEGRGAPEVASDDGFLLFCLQGTSEAEVGLFVEAVFDVLELLRSRSESLAGFNLIVDATETNDHEAILLALRRALRATSRDNELWVGAEALTVLRDYLRFETTGTSRRVIGRRDQATPRLGTYGDFLADEHAVERFLTAIDGWLMGTERPGTLVIEGGDLESALTSVRHALGKIYGETPAWVEVAPGPAELPLESILRSIGGSKSIAEESVMSSPEKAVWQSQRAFLEDRSGYPGGRRIADEAVSDTWRAAGTAISSRIREASRNRAVPAVVFHRAESLSPQVVAGMAKLLADLPADCDAIRIVIHGRESTESLSPFLFAAPIRHLRFDDLDAEAFAARADLFLSDAAKRKVRLTKGLKETRGRLSSAFYHFLVFQDKRDLALNARPDDLKVPPESRDASLVLTGLPPETKEHLWAFHIADGRLPLTLLQDALEQTGYNRHRVATSVESLRRLGFLETTDYPSARLGPLEKVLKRQIGSAARELESAMSHWLMQSALNGPLVPTPHLLPIVLRGAEIRELLHFFCELVHRLLDAKDYATAERLVYREVPLTRVARQAGAFQELEAVLYGARLRLALCRQDWKTANALWSSRQQVNGTGVYQGLVHLELGRYALSQRQVNDAKTYVKRAMVELQDEDSNWTNSASIDFGIVLMARHKLSDAREYFVMARPKTPTPATTYNYIRSIFMEAIALFLRGSYSQVIAYAEQLVEATETEFMRSWGAFARFLHARVLLELGRYSEAQYLLEQTISLARGYGLFQAIKVCKAWLARAQTLKGHHKEAMAILTELPESTERNYFLADLLQLIGNDRESLELLEKVLLVVRNSEPVPPDVVQWSSGFASLEDRVFGLATGEPVLYWLARSLRGMVMARSGDHAEAIADLHDLTRSPDISPEDPYNSRYYYIYSQVLPQQRSPEVDDFLTVLGKAVKFFQERNSRIDLYRQKISFMQENAWNRELISAAEAQNLL